MRERGGRRRGELRSTLQERVRGGDLDWNEVGWSHRDCGEIPPMTKRWDVIALCLLGGACTLASCQDSVSPPPTPSETGCVQGSLDTPGITVNVVVSGSYAYIEAWDDGLKIVDISTPTSPKLVAAVNTDRIEGLVVVGNYVYTAGWRGLKVIDVSSPETPTVVGSFGDLVACRGLAVVGNYAYVTAFGSEGHTGLVVIDITTPTAPQRVGSVAIPNVYMEDVDVSGGYAYVAAGRSGFYVFDVSTPNATSLVTTID